MKHFCSLSLLAATCTASAQSLYSSVTLGSTTSRTDNALVSSRGAVGALTGTVSAQSDFGVMHASAEATNAGGSSFVYDSALSSFGDLITITGGTGAGEYLADMTADGSLSSSGTANAHAQILWDSLPNGVNGGVLAGAHIYLGLYKKTFTYGVPFSIYGQLIAEVTFFGGAGTGSADFSHTATLSAIHVLDAKGTPVPGLTITSASGHVYPQAVPEPSLFAVFGLGAVAFARRRKGASPTR